MSSNGTSVGAGAGGNVVVFDVESPPPVQEQEQEQKQIEATTKETGKATTKKHQATTKKSNKKISHHDKFIENPPITKPDPPAHPVGHVAQQQKKKQQESAKLGKLKRSDSTRSLDGSSSVTSHSSYRSSMVNMLVALLIVILGAGTGAAFLTVGVKTAREEQSDQFSRRSKDLVNKLQRAWEEYVTAAAWIHGRCRSRNFTRADFRETYEYLINSGLSFQAAQFDPNITRDEREEAEAEARDYYAKNYPHFEYDGFVGFNTANQTQLEPRWQADFYFPIHYMEPVMTNEPAIDLDYHASGSRKETVLFCMNEGQPALTDRLNLVQETRSGAFGVVLMHPGYNLTTQNDVWPRDLASIVIRIPDLLSRAAENERESSAVYLFDTTEESRLPIFLGGVEVEAQGGGDTLAVLNFQNETNLTDVMNAAGNLHFQEDIKAANKRWTVAIYAVEGTYKPDTIFEVLGGVIIFVASGCLACFVFSNTRRVEQFNKMRAAADAEKAALIIDNARQATKAERELNDFIAHEVRNPVAAAMSACSFVKAAVHEENPLSSAEQKQETREDVGIIDNALRFVNDLLRNMLDMHRAANKQLKVNMTPTDILHDILEPVSAMLPQRDTKFEIQVECKEGLVVMTDRLRLKQVCLNLARNSVKFVDKGFVRLRAEIINEHVHVFIEDSGPGIPFEKREMLFAKFQESLDSLSQGTGIGLFLCKNLVELMEGDIHLDNDFHSGIPGCPGTRFVVNLKQTPIESHFIDKLQGSGRDGGATGETESMLTEEDVIDEESVPKSLPDSLSVLFVDDDPILRKLFTRTVRTVAPTWKIREASNGETALRLVDSEDTSFDLIFMDMYMASVEKQLLGTETVRALRMKGVSCRICGLSANDKESEFLEAGADVFTFKPFPCEARALTQELCRVLYRDSDVKSA